MGFRIRALAPDDQAQWQDQWRAYLTFYETKLPSRIFETTWRRLMTKGEDPHGLCAVSDNDRLVGIVHYMFHRSCWTEGPYCYLQDLFVPEEARGQGLGRALIEAVADAANQHNASQVYWLTQHFNKQARHLYDQVADVTPFVKYVKNISPG